MGIEKIATIAIAFAISSTSVMASEEPLEGQYLQNRPCTGTRTDPEGLKVTITSQEIVYSGGVCSIDSRRNEGDKTAFAVTCKFRSGAVMGANIALMRRDANSLQMEQQDGTFRAVLHRCPK